MQSQKWQDDLCFQDKSLNTTLIQVYAPTNDAEEAEVQWFYEDLQDFLEWTHTQKCPFSLQGTGMQK